MRYIIAILLMATVVSAQQPQPHDIWVSKYQGSLDGVTTKTENGKCVIIKWNPSLGAQPTQAQIDAVVDSYQSDLSSRQSAANALYSTISTRLGLATPITTKAQLQSHLTEVWDAMDDKEQQVWTAIEASGLNATRAGQLKQLAQARNKILRLLAEDGIQ